MRLVSCHRRAFLLLVMLLPAAIASGQTAPTATRFPADKASGVNPDTHLVLTFASAPRLGNTGQIRIYDAADNKLVDTLDMSIPSGPAAAGRGAAGARGGRAPGRGAAQAATTAYQYATGKRLTNANTIAGTPTANAVATPRDAQLTIIGGFSDGFHFYPVIVHDNTATIYPHNNLLDFNKTYYVQIDPGVLTVEDNSFTGIAGTAGWTFSTKKTPPPADADRLVVAADGSGDFNTVQGAIDFIPDENPERVTIFIRDGTYEEIVYFRNKSNITFLGEDRDKVVIAYRNSEAFNGPGANRTNEVPNTFPYRRAVFMADHSTGIQLVNLSVKNTWGTGSQAEALLFMGGQNLASHVSLYGNTDTLQFNDSVYISDSAIQGGGDFLWGRGPAFFNNCQITELGNNPMMWIRSTSAAHGFVYLNCKFNAPKSTGAGAILARNTADYPFSEVVLLNCAIGGISPVTWTIPGDPTNLHYWEFNTTNLADGKPADTTRRAAGSKQLTMAADAKTIADYSNPAYVLSGWTPAMAPLILTQPAAITIPAGQPATVTAQFAAVPPATYQWFKNGVAIAGALDATLKLNNITAADAASYTVTATNNSGSATSNSAALSIK